MKRFSCFFIWIFVLTSILPAQEREVKLKVVQTSDIHGNYYPYDFIRRREATGSLARVHALVQKERETYGENLILLDNGDFCTFDVFLPLEENAFLAVGHHGKATEPDEPVVFRITTDF